MCLVLYNELAPLNRVLVDLKAVTGHHGPTIVVYGSQKLAGGFTFVVRSLALVPCKGRIIAHLWARTIDVLL